MSINQTTLQYTLLLTLVFFGFNVVQARAADVRVDPILIDEAVSARDVVIKNVTITNLTDHRLQVFATVNEVEVGTTGEIKQFVTPVMTDQTNTVTSWIEVTRGMLEIDPQETETVPITLRINTNAKAGTYHAFVGFVSGPDRPTAEAVALRGDANGTIVKIALVDKRNELLRISSFLMSRFVFLATQHEVTVEVENSGDTPLTPKGEIIFYNSRGEEVSSVRVNEAGVSITPGETRSLSAQIPFYDKLGRFKANVKLDYGEIKKSTVFDTSQFFMIPLYLVIAIGLAIAVISLLLTYLLRRAFYDELHEEDDGAEVPLYIRNDRDHEVKDHDIHIQKN